MVRKDPMNVLLCPILGEADIMKKNTQYSADGAKGLRVVDIIDTNSEFGTAQEILTLGNPPQSTNSSGSHKDLNLT